MPLKRVFHLLGAGVESDGARRENDVLDVLVHGLGPEHAQLAQVLEVPVPLPRSQQVALRKGKLSLKQTETF